MKTKNLLACAIFGLFANFSQASVIDFNNETTGPHFDPYLINGVQFTDSVSNFLIVQPFPESFGSNSLATPTDDDSYLSILFPSLMNYLALDFGNDDPRVVQPGDQAMLYLFQGNLLVFVTSMDLNGNDLADQTISATGFEFNAAVFVYTDSGGNAIALSELVDNVVYTAAPSNVPEPGTPLMLGAGLAAAALARRRAAQRVT